MELEVAGDGAGIATVAEDETEPGRPVPHDPQKRFRSGTSLAHLRQRIGR